MDAIIYVERQDGRVAQIELECEDGDVREALERTFPESYGAMEDGMVSADYRGDVDEAFGADDDEALSEWLQTWTAEVVDEDAPSHSHFRPLVLGRFSGPTYEEAVADAVSWAEENIAREGMDDLAYIGRRYYVSCGDKEPWTIDDYMQSLAECDVDSLLYQAKETECVEDRKEIGEDILRLLDQVEDAGLEIGGLRARAMKELADMGALL